MQPVRIRNPISGPGYTSHNRAARFVRKGRARWIGSGEREIEIIAKPARAVFAHRPCLPMVCDATPGRAVCPPWPGWDRRLLTSGVQGARP